MFSGRWEGDATRDRDGRVLLDRDPDAFAVILNYLRDVASRAGPHDGVALDRQVDARLARELDFYGIRASGALLCEAVRAAWGVYRLYIP